MSGVSSAKPYDIAKRTVWDAYQQVRANRGAAGIDDETIADFERDLSKNLYKLWNRMSSGSYFPPPVKQVEIPGYTDLMVDGAPSPHQSDTTLRWLIDRLRS